MTDTGLSAKIREAVARQEDEKRRVIQEAIAVGRLRAIAGERRTGGGQSRLKAHVGQSTERKRRVRARARAADASRRKNR